MSLIAILVDVKTGSLLNETLRWNHVIEPSHTNPGASVDKAFKNNWGDLSQVVGMNVKAAKAVYDLAREVGIPKDLKAIIKEEDLDFLAQSAVDDACFPGNPRKTTKADVIDLYKKLL